MTGIYIAIEGPTGVGKSTLAAALARAMDGELLADPFTVNPYLEALLTGDPTPELPVLVELTFVALRVAQLRAAAATLAAGGTVVADWALLKTPIFAGTTLPAGDAQRIADTCTVWAPSLPTPDVLIGMSASLPTLRARVARRGRAMEAGLTPAALRTLRAAFDAAYVAWPGRLIRLDANRFDSFDPDHIAELAARCRPLPSLRRPCETDSPRRADPHTAVNDPGAAAAGDAHRPGPGRPDHRAAATTEPR
ncbi:deoxyadenosine/deoxycytidine kinase [Krasilnikovia cinnamomea]|uniref:Deoxyadenosine/deoxycytidine kinase n=1 Tax=Krasilnikovia cinnamomea TaxID=349313 RepID=A0A4Q7Z943_9ACTN|nr:deoxynucleoside kinase [Krasilnikovia cinnamomea]RZU46574.1 deoxyadenosine/deoxycytidine kinase [Krasilnikovia cinnamomea]